MAVSVMPKPDWQEPAEQFGHFVLGICARLTFLDYLLWRREAVTQWPPGDPFIADKLMQKGHGELVTQLDRVQDMMTDMRWYTIGGTVADIARAWFVLWWVFA